MVCRKKYLVFSIHTMAPFSTAARRTRRPILPNPLIPILDILKLGTWMSCRLAGRRKQTERHAAAKCRPLQVPLLRLTFFHLHTLATHRFREKMIIHQLLALYKVVSKFFCTAVLRKCTKPIDITVFY